MKYKRSPSSSHSNHVHSLSHVAWYHRYNRPNLFCRLPSLRPTPLSSPIHFCFSLSYYLFLAALDLYTMQKEASRSNMQPTQQIVPNVDTLISAYSSLDEEQQEIDKMKGRMIIPSVESLYADPSIFSDFPLPVGFLVQPFASERESLLKVERRPIRCEKCGAVASFLSEIDEEGKWVCCFCNERSSIPYGGESAVKTSSTDMRSLYQELDPKWTSVEYVSVPDDRSALYSPVTENRAILFLIDKSLSPNQFQQIRDALSVFLFDPALSNYYMGLVIFGEVIEIYEMEGSIGAADVFSGTQLPSPSVSPFPLSHVGRVISPPARARGQRSSRGRRLFQLPFSRARTREPPPLPPRHLRRRLSPTARSSVLPLASGGHQLRPTSSLHARLRCRHRRALFLLLLPRAAARPLAPLRHAGRIRDDF